MVVTATPRGREVGQIFEFWRNVGANVTIDQTDQTALVTKAFRRDFQLTPWRIIDLADPNPQMYANFHTSSPVNLANYSNPEAERRLEFHQVVCSSRRRISRPPSLLHSASSIFRIELDYLIAVALC